MPEITIESDGKSVTLQADGQSVDASALAGKVAEAVEKVPPAEHDSPGAELASELVPIVLFLAIALTYCTKYYFGFREKQGLQKTVQSALERGDPMTGELLDRLVQPPKPKRNDLRRGVIAIGLGIGLGAFGFIIGEPDAVRPMLATGFVPLLLGLAYLALWRLDRSRD